MKNKRTMVAKSFCRLTSKLICILTPGSQATGIQAVILTILCTSVHWYIRIQTRPFSQAVSRIKHSTRLQSWERIFYQLLRAWNKRQWRIVVIVWVLLSKTRQIKTIQRTTWWQISLRLLAEALMRLTCSGLHPKRRVSCRTWRGLAHPGPKRKSRQAPLVALSSTLSRN